MKKRKIVENGMTYTICEDDNGKVLSKCISDGEVIEPTEPTITESERAILETAINTEYLVCLADLGI